MNGKKVKAVSLRAALQRSRDRVTLTRNRKQLALWDLAIKPYPSGEVERLSAIDYTTAQRLRMQALLLMALKMLGLPAGLQEAAKEEIAKTEGSPPSRLTALANYYGLNTYERLARPSLNFGSSRKAGGAGA